VAIHDLDKLLRPQSMAVIGASDRNNVGGRVVKGALDLGYQGRLYPVNPRYETAQGLKCYPSLAALPEVPDCVVMSVPASAAMPILPEVEASGIPAMVFLSEGFTDAGTAEGLERNDILLAMAARSGMTISGPNSAGMVGLKGGYNAAFVNFPRDLKAGPISIVSQSGGLNNAVLELGRNRGFGFNYILSAGNEIIVNSADYIDWLADDPDTGVIINILEGVKDGPAYRAALERAARIKPVVVLKLGRSEAGQRATLAHTGSLAGEDRVFRAICHQSGAIVVDSLDQALETANVLLRAPLPTGERVLVFSTSGGASVLSGDLGSAAGIAFPLIGEATNAGLQEILEVGRPFPNPMDVTGSPRISKGDNMTRCLNLMLADPDIDAIGFVMVLQRDEGANRKILMSQMEAVAKTADKPIVLISEMAWHWNDLPDDIGLPIAATLNDGMVAFRALFDYAAFRRRVTGEAMEPPAAIEVPPVRPVLTEFESKKILAGAGLPVTREDLALSLEDAAAMAERIGYPVALKAQSPELLHKSDAGAIRLGVADEAQLRAAYGELAALPDLDGILIQEMVARGAEFLLGMHWDETFGPVIAFGPGGIFVELIGEAALAVPPLRRGDGDALLVAAPAAKRLVEGFRGLPAADRQALAGLIERFAVFVSATHGQLAAVDINPLTVLPGGQAKVVDASIVLKS
jgi:acyl-CoA synthetase (NDP forming)